MSSAPTRVQYEGTWEEVARHGAQLAGKRVRVTVLSDDLPELRHAAAELMKEIDALEPDLNGVPLKGQSAEFAEGVAAKLSSQGIGRDPH